jgi:hypothetical protein
MNTGPFSFNPHFSETSAYARWTKLFNASYFTIRFLVSVSESDSIWTHRVPKELLPLPEQDGLEKGEWIRSDLSTLPRLAVHIRNSSFTMKDASTS